MSRKPKVDCTCIQCAIAFQTYYAWYKRGAGKFCSTACQDEYRRGKSYEEFYGTSKAAHLREHYSATLRGSNNPNYGNKKLVGSNNPNWLGGLSKQRYAKGITFALKERVRTRYGRGCVVCGVTERELGKRLPVHHIDYDKTNHSEDNLIPCCVTCHSKTNFNREAWVKLFKEKVCQHSALV